MKSFKSLAFAVSSLCVLPAVAHGKESNTAGQVGMAMMRLNAAPLSEGSQGHFAEAQNHHTHHRLHTAAAAFGKV